MRVRRMLVLAGGALGSGARYLVGAWLADRYGTGFPWGTLSLPAAALGLALMRRL